MSEQRGAEPDHLRLFHFHVSAYALGLALLVVIDLAITDGWWFFWPVLAWGVLVLVHYLYVKSIHVDNRWAEERADRVLDKAYDLGHIEDIHQRYEGGNPRAGDNRSVED